ncbi:MAG TPA: hypothetical protein VGW38_13130 [Chloroflexota bacterium]|nr:hypothetical protein [Chloroflexota bacterium]
MIQLGKIALLIWAAGIAYVGYLLIAGQSKVAMTAIEAGRISEAVVQFAFITVVFIGTAIACGLFTIVGVLRE